MTSCELRPFSFETFSALVDSRLPGYARATLFYALPELWQREAWQALEDKSRRECQEAQR